MNRRFRAILGALLLTIGIGGVVSIGAFTASAREGSTEDSHAVMHEMMDAVHGVGTADRVHRVEGAEEMMEQCSQMMTMMRRMNDGGMMGRMMGSDMGKMMEMMQR